MRNFYPQTVFKDKKMTMDKVFSFMDGIFIHHILITQGRVLLNGLQRFWLIFAKYGNLSEQNVMDNYYIHRLTDFING